MITTLDDLQGKIQEFLESYSKRHKETDDGPSKDLTQDVTLDLRVLRNMVGEVRDYQGQREKVIANTARLSERHKSTATPADCARALGYELEEIEDMRRTAWAAKHDRWCTDADGPVYWIDQLSDEFLRIGLDVWPSGTPKWSEVARAAVDRDMKGGE
jgi:hypothetical protein